MCRLCCSEQDQAAGRPAVVPVLCVMGLMSLAATRFCTIVNIAVPLGTPSVRHGRTLLSLDAETKVPFFMVSVAM